MLGEQRFQVLDAGRKYRLSDGTELEFLNRNGANGPVAGVSGAALVAVLVHRFKALREANPAGARVLSLVVTELQSAENWMARWDSERRMAQARAAEAVAG